VKYSGYFPTLVLAAATVFFAYDIVADVLSDDEGRLHLLVESVVFAAVITALFAELRRVIKLKAEVSRGREQVARLSGELQRMMQKQFEKWRLSPSESEVALLLIKGLTMKEISVARGVKEKTVRQQAASIYAKSGCGGRHELAANFIEDLLGATDDAGR